MPNRKRVFVSYSRRDLEFVTRLVSDLEDRHFDVDHDLGGDAERIERGIALTDPWWTRLQENIVAADVVLVIVSPDLVASRICGDEIAWAQSLQKRIVAAVYRWVNPAIVPPPLAALNLALPLSRDAVADVAFHSYQDSLSQLCRVLQLDIAWHRDGARLLGLARQWNQDERRTSRLLRLEQVESALAWAARRPAEARPPPDLVLEFIQQSHVAELASQQRLRRIVGRSFVAPADRRSKIADTSDASA